MNATLRAGAHALLCLCIIACSELTEPLEDASPPEIRYSADPISLSGSVLLPNGKNICNQFPVGFEYQVSFIRVVQDGPDVGSSSPVLYCPNNSFSISVLEPGDYVVRGLTDAFADPDSRFPYFPWTALTITGPASEVPIVFGNGRVIGGTATMDGAPVEGAEASFRPTITDHETRNIPAVAVSHADGTWGERRGTYGPATRARTWLQPGIEYSAECGRLGGAIPFASSASTFVFGDVTRFNCRYRPSRAAGWTHVATALDVTAGPGYFGIDGFGDNGYGYGVQYPSTTPVRNPWSADSHMYDGGFLIAVGGAVLSTFDPTGHLLCATCRDFTAVSARPRVSEGLGGTKEVLWRLTDSGSPEGVGLEFQQRSFDGTGGDYVLFRLTLTNTSAVALDLHLGFFADWDVAMSSGGHSAGLQGDIAYSTRPDGPIMGSVFLGDHSRGFFGFLNGLASTFRSVPAQVSWLDGSLNNSLVEGNDVKYVHSVRDIRLRAGRKRDFWFALVAGATQAELAANAAAAEADMNARLGG